MDPVKTSELEVIRYETIRHLHIFLVNILFRNMHEHSDFELSVILRGSARIRGRDGEIRAGEGAILLFNSYEPHEIASDTPQPLQILSVQINNHFCEEYFPRLRNLEFGVTVISDVLPPEVCRRVREQIFLTAIRFLREGPDFQYECVGNVSMLLYQLIRHLPHDTIDDQEYAARKRRTARIRRITTYIDQHYKERITLPDLAAREKITTTYLSHFFHDTFHMTFQEYLSRLRLEKALILMQNPGLYLVDVCMECGFSDSKYLNQMFRKKFGCTASEYRRERILPPGDGAAPEPASYSEYRYPRQDCLSLLEQYLGTETFCRLAGPTNF